MQWNAKIGLLHATMFGLEALGFADLGESDLVLTGAHSSAHEESALPFHFYKLFLYHP